MIIDRLFQKLQQQNLIDWGVIYHGCQGIPGLNLKIKIDDIENFAIKKIENLEGNTLIIVADLASAKYLDRGEITELLDEICMIEHINLDISLKKWRLVMLEEIIENLSYDCLYDLIELTDFWVYWKNPADKPHIIQGVDSDMSPIDYYSDDNFNKLLKAHQIWIIEEKQRIYG